MFPAQRRHVLQHVVGDIATALTQMGDGAAEVDGVPVDDGADDQIALRPSRAGRIRKLPSRPQVSRLRHCQIAPSFNRRHLRGIGQGVIFYETAWRLPFRELEEVALIGGPAAGDRRVPHETERPQMSSPSAFGQRYFNKAPETGQ